MAEMPSHSFVGSPLEREDTQCTPLKRLGSDRVRRVNSRLSIASLRHPKILSPSALSQEADEEELLLSEIVAAASRDGVTNATEFLDWVELKCPFLTNYFSRHEARCRELFRRPTPLPGGLVLAPSLLVETSSAIYAASTGIVSSRHKQGKETLAAKLRKKIATSSGTPEAMPSEGQPVTPGPPSTASGFAHANERYATATQKDTERLLRKWYWLQLFARLVLTLVNWYNFTMIPIRIAVGSGSMPPQLWVGELVLDALLLLGIVLDFVAPVEVQGRTEVDPEAIRKRYLRRGFPRDLAAAFPLQIIILPLTRSGHATTGLEDFMRINRLINYTQFSSHFDHFADTYMRAVHPTVMRIVKFVLILWFYSIICSAPVGLLTRQDPNNTAIWLETEGEDTATEFLEVFLLVLGLAAGRNYNYPITVQQTGVMLVLALFSLGSTSVIIAGVTAMIQSLVERSSTLSNKLDAVMHELGHLGVDGELRDEVLLYYQSMFALFNTFDYQKSSDFFEDMPIELQNAIYDEVSIATIKALPLFADIVHDVDFVRALAGCLELYVLMPGTEIVRRGDDGEEMFFISKGTASVIVDGVEVAVLKEGSFFGEQALLFGVVRTATIVSKTLCQVYALSRADFDAMIDLRPEALERILEVTMTRRQASDQVSAAADLHVTVSSPSRAGTSSRSASRATGGGARLDDEIFSDRGAPIRAPRSASSSQLSTPDVRSLHPLAEAVPANPLALPQ